MECSSLCPNGLAWCIFECGVAVFALAFIASMIGFEFNAKKKGEKDV